MRASPIAPAVPLSKRASTPGANNVIERNSPVAV
jgi:hypothetical protein